MPRRQFNDGMEIEFDDLNKVAQAMEKEIFDRLAFELGGRQQNFFFADSFLVSFSSGLNVSVNAGLGIQTDNSQVDPEPTKRAVYRSTATLKALAAGDAAHDRIDIVCVKSLRVTVLSELRNFKDAITSVISLQTMVTQTDYQADIVTVQGTPAASPVAPAVPSGYIQVAAVIVRQNALVINPVDITDSRTVYIVPGSVVTSITVAADRTLKPSDYLVRFNTTALGRQCFLPAAASVPSKVFVVKVVLGANGVTIVPFGTEKIDGENGQILGALYTSMTIVSNGVDGWDIIG